MAKADRVHSTPPINSSSFPDDRDPPEARSESVDSFPSPPLTGRQPACAIENLSRIRIAYRDTVKEIHRARRDPFSAGFSMSGVKHQGSRSNP
jgi:hypothetical protein